MGLNRDDLLKIPTLTIEEVDVPVWGKIRLAAFSAVDQISLREFIAIEEGLSSPARKVAEVERLAKIAARVMVNDDGDRLLQDEEYPVLLQKVGALTALNCIVDAVYRINGMYVEQAVKNSEPSASESSATA